MKKNYLYEKMSEIDEKYIAEAMYPEKFRKKETRGINKRRFILLAATIAILASACVALPLLLRSDDTPDIGKYDFSSPEFADFEMDGTTLVAYKGDGAEELILPEGIEAIADYAFYENKNSTDIKIISFSSTVKKVGNNSFAGCDKLESLIINGDSGDFTEHDDLLMTADGETIIKYLGDESQKSFTIPSGVKYIAAHAFQLSELEHVTFPDTLLYIGYNAFSSLPLKEIILPESVIEIADGAFSGCVNALEGSYPENLKIGENSFDIVPFYLTMLAGKPCPSEDFQRGSVTLTEAFRQSNAEFITGQFEDIIEYYNTGIMPDPYDTSCYAALNSGQPMPKGALLPSMDDLDFSSLKIVESTWGAQTNADIIIPCEGGYDMVIGYRIYDIWSPLYWEDVKWRAEAISFIPTDAAKSADIAIGDWYIEFETDAESGRYTALTFTNTEGESFYEFRFQSEEPYRLAISPDGQKFIVEYMSSGAWSFFIEDLSGGLYHTWWSYTAPCIPYFQKADGIYFPHTAAFNNDPETMEEYPVIAENEQGVFLMDWSEDLIRNNTISGEDTVMYYDVKYVHREYKAEYVTKDSLPISNNDPIYDGADKIVSDSYVVNVIYDLTSNEDDRFTNGELAVIFDAPHTWLGILDIEREKATRYPSFRYEAFGGVYKVFPYYKLTYDDLVGYYSLLKYPESTFTRIEVNSKTIKEYAYVKHTDVVWDAIRTTYFFNVITADNYLIPLYMYSYRDDSADYFERVICPVIESIRLAEGCRIEDMSAKPEDDKVIFTAEFKNSTGKELSGTLDLCDVAPCKLEENVSLSGGTLDKLGYVNFAIRESDGKYYLSFDDMVYSYVFILENGSWVRVS